MSIYEVRVKPEVARLRQGDAGTRNVAVVHRFSRHPTLFVGELPPELRADAALEVRQLAGEEARQVLRLGALVSAVDCHTERLVRTLAGIARPGQPAPPLAAGAGPQDLRSRVEALERAVAELQGEQREEPQDERSALLARLPEVSRAELDELHQKVLGKKPHGNARDESVRDAIRQALEGGDGGDSGDSSDGDKE